MEYCEGGSLEDFPKPIGESQACSLMKQLVKGMSVLEGANIMHRDIKPAVNIVVF